MNDRNSIDANELLKKIDEMRAILDGRALLAAL